MGRFFIYNNRPRNRSNVDGTFGKTMPMSSRRTPFKAEELTGSKETTPPRDQHLTHMFLFAAHVGPK